MNYTHNIPPHGYVRYLDHMGSDQRIVEAARVSYNSPSKGKEADDKLLVYLFKNRHTSPFEQCSISFNIKMPIFVMRQFVRHRTFRLNEVSARYTELPEETYIPQVWRKQQESGNKQGSVEETSPLWNHYNCDVAKVAYDEAFKAYDTLLKRGVAKELARIVLPVGVYTEIYVNCDLHNLMHFLRLRLHPHAQLEIQDVAKGMLKIMWQYFPVTAAAFQKYQFKMVEQNADGLWQ